MERACSRGPSGALRYTTSSSSAGSSSSAAASPPPPQEWEEVRLRFEAAPKPGPSTPLAWRGVSLLTQDVSEIPLHTSLMEAYREGDVAGQIFFLKRLAKWFEAKGRLEEAAHALNGCAVLAGPERDAILSELERLEALYLLKTFEQTTPGSHRNYLEGHRAYLAKSRCIAKSMIESGTPPEEVQRYLTGQYESLLRMLAQEAADLLGIDLQSLSLIVLGSVARFETAPYSDIDFGFLISKESPRKRREVESLSQLLAFKIMNLGETEWKIIREVPERSYTSSGFCVDRGLLSPGAGLISTPESLLEARRSGEVILANATGAVRHLVGDTSLVERLGKSGIDRRRALELLRGHEREFRPTLGQGKIELRAVGIKAELYRALQMVVSALALYYGAPGINTLEQIHSLESMGVFSHEGAAVLVGTMRKISRLRIKAQLHYGGEEEILYYPRGVDDPRAKGLFLITPEIEKEIEEIYQTLFPLYRHVVDFLDGDRAAFSRCSFHDPIVGRSDDRLRRSYEFDAALLLSETRSALHPSDPVARWGLGLVNVDLGQARRAILNYQAAFDQLEMKDGEEAAALLGNLGTAYRTAGEFVEAEKRYLDSLALWASLGKEAGRLRCHLGGIYYLTGRIGAAKEQYAAGLSSSDKTTRAGSLMGLGNIALGAGEAEEAISLYQSALELWGEQDLPEVARTLDNLGCAHRALRGAPAAIAAFRSALGMWERLYRGKPHPEVARTFGNLGNLYQEEGVFDEAMRCYRSSLAMWKEIDLDSSHPMQRSVAMNIATLERAMGNSSLAVESYCKLLENWRGELGDRAHPEVARLWGGIGNGLQELRRLDEAMECYRIALAMWTELYRAEPNMDRARVLNNLALAHHRMGHLKTAASLYHSSLTMKRRVRRGAGHPGTAATLYNLGRVYFHRRQFDEAIRYHMDSIAMLKGVWGKVPHFELARGQRELGDTFLESGQTSEAAHSYVDSFATLYALAKIRQDRRISPALRALGDAFRGLSQPMHAIQAYALSLKSERLPTLHSATAARRMGLAAAEMGNLGQAVMSFDFSLSILQQVSAKEAPTLELGRAYGNLANAMRSPDKAALCYEMCLSILKELPEEHHREVVGTLHSLGECYSQIGIWDRAITRLEEALAMEKDDASIWNDLGLVYHWKGDSDLAKKCLMRALSMKEEACGGVPNCDVATTLANLGLVCTGEEATDFLKRGYEMFLARVGADDPRTIKAKANYKRGGR